MARGQNRVMLIGFLGRDPEMRYTPTGRPVTAFSLVVAGISGGSPGAQPEPRTRFTVLAWGPLAEACGTVLAKNDRAYVEGHLQTRRWTRGDGKERVRPEVVAARVIPLERGASAPQYESGSFMPSGLNLGLLIGNLGHDPEMRHAPDGQAVTCFSLAVGRTRPTADGEKQDATEWFNIVARGPLAEICHHHLQKGHRVYVEGELRFVGYADREGGTEYGTLLHASDMIMLSPRPTVPSAEGQTGT